MFLEQLSEVLSESYTLMSRVEESMVNCTKTLNLTISEIHMMEIIGKGNTKGKTITEIAAELSVTLSSVTVAVNKLEKKKYVVKHRDDADGRMVYVQLTSSGDRIYRLNKRLHRNLAVNIARGFSEQEKEILLKGIIKMNSFLRRKAEKLEGNR